MGHMDGDILGWLRVGLTPTIKNQMEIRVGHEMETVRICMVVFCIKRSKEYWLVVGKEISELRV